MSIRYNYVPVGAGPLPVNTAGQGQDGQTATHGKSAAPAADDKPFSTSPGTAFPSSGKPKQSYCVSPDGRSRTWTTIGQDPSGTQHPFLKRTFRFTSPEGMTTVRTVETHWTITPSKDGRPRSVRYETTRDDHLYDPSGRDLTAHHKKSFKGSFESDGRPLPFEEPLLCPWPQDGHRSDDEQAKARGQQRQTWRKK